jgi:hypothetical protein
MEYQTCISHAQANSEPLSSPTEVSGNRVCTQTYSVFENTSSLDQFEPTRAIFIIPPDTDCLDGVDIILSIPNFALQCMVDVDERGMAATKTEGGQLRFVVPDGDGFPRDRSDGVVRTGNRALLFDNSALPQIWSSSFWSNFVDSVTLCCGEGDDAEELSTLSGRALNWCASQQHYGDDNGATNAVALRLPFFSHEQPFPLFLLKKRLSIEIQLKSFHHAFSNRKELFQTPKQAGFGSVPIQLVVLPDTAEEVASATNLLHPRLNGSAFGLGLIVSGSNFFSSKDRKCLKEQEFVFPILQHQIIGTCLDCSNDDPAEFDLTTGYNPLRLVWCSLTSHAEPELPAFEEFDIDIMGKSRITLPTEPMHSLVFPDTVVYNLVDFTDADAVVFTDSRSPDLSRLPSVVMHATPYPEAGRVTINAEALVENRVLLNSGTAAFERFRDGDGCFNSVEYNAEEAEDLV